MLVELPRESPLRAIERRWNAFSRDSKSSPVVVGTLISSLISIGDDYSCVECSATIRKRDQRVNVQLQYIWQLDR